MLTTLGGLFGTTALGYVQKYMVAHGSPDDFSMYGDSLALFVMFGYIASVPLYFLAGKKYEKQMQEIDKKEALI